MVIKKTWRYPSGLTEVEYLQCSRYGDHSPRGKKKKATPEEMQAVNEKQAIKRLTRIIRWNFTEEDWHMVLTYRKEARPTPEEAREELKGFFRQLRNAYRKAGWELKYITVTEYLNSAIHHHVIINEIPGMQKIIRGLWVSGRPNFTPLDRDGDVGELAGYLVKETRKTMRRRKGQRRYTASKSLAVPRPEIEIVTGREFEQKIRTPRNMELLPDSLEEGFNKYGYPYRRYLMKRKPVKKQSRKKAKGTRDRPVMGHGRNESGDPKGRSGKEGTGIDISGIFKNEGCGSGSNRV